MNHYEFEAVIWHIPTKKWVETQQWSSGHDVAEAREIMELDAKWTLISAYDQDGEDIDIDGIDCADDYPEGFFKKAREEMRREQGFRRFEAYNDSGCFGRAGF